MKKSDSVRDVKISPIEVQLKKGETYFWCACGKSQNQPFCDGAHKGTEYTPVKFTADIDGSKWLCACKKTQNQPDCDGSHNNRTGEDWL